MAFNRSSHRQNVAIILSSMGFLLWGCNGCCTPNLEEEAHGFNKWQLGLLFFRHATFCDNPASRLARVGATNPAAGSGVNRVTEPEGVPLLLREVGEANRRATTAR